MQLSVFGLDHSGALMAACLASQGHGVIAVDPDEDRIAALRCSADPALQFTADIAHAIANTSLSAICIAAPGARDEQCQRADLAALCERIGGALRGKAKFHALALRGFLPAGAVHAVMIPALERASGKRAGVDFGLAVYPHFLNPDSAVEEYFNPPAIILGVTDDETLARLREMDIAVEAPEIVVGLAEAEAMTRIDAAELVAYLATADEPSAVSRFALGADNPLPA